jgi:hypothetical protein
VQVITLVCFVQAVVLILVGGAVMLGIATAAAGMLARDLKQLSRAVGTRLARTRADAAAKTATRQTAHAGTSGQQPVVVLAMLSDLIAAAGMMGVSGYVAYSVAF